jgi:hypothetical protein
VRPDEDIDLALAVGVQNLLHVGRPAKARDHLDGDREVAIALAEGVPVLLRKDRRGREEEGLAPIRRRDEGCAHADLRLPEADVAADEAVHRAGCLEVLLDGFDRRQLVRSLLVGEARLELLDELVVGGEGHAFGALPLRVESDQLAGELVRPGAGTALDGVPRLAAELGQRRRVPVGADVSGHLPDLLVRDVEAVVALEAEEEVVARDPGDGLRLEAKELPDAVILVDDIVAGAQVGEALQRAADTRVGARRALPEDLGVREEDEAELAEDKTAPRGRDGEEEAFLIRELVARLQHLRLDAAEEGFRPERLPAVREGDHDTVPATHEREQVALGLREPARRNRGALGLERVALAGRELAELRSAAEAELNAELLLHGLACVVRLPDESGGGKWQDEVVRRRRRLVLEPRLDEVGATLGGGMDERLVERVQRALREGRVGAQRLDLVPQELEANRLAARGRVDVDDAAAHGELAALLRLLDALVARERELLDELLAPRRVALAKANGLGPGFGRRHTLGRADRGGADEPAGLEDPERTGAFADEVRRRLEAAPPADSTRGEEADVLLAEKPARGLGCVARLGVVREDGDERPAALVEDRGEKEWDERLGHACSRGRRDELAEALALGELAGEGAECRLVHDE